MKVMVEFFAYLREKTGTPGMDVTFIGSTVMDLIGALDGMFLGAFRDQLMEGEELKGMVKVLVNGVDVRALRGLNTELKETDVVSIFPPAAGG